MVRRGVPDESERSLGDQIRAVLASPAVRVPWQQVLLVVVPEELRKVRVRVDLMEVAEELVESLLGRRARRTGISKSPLAEAAGAIAAPAAPRPASRPRREWGSCLRWL